MCTEENKGKQGLNYVEMLPYFGVKALPKTCICVNFVPNSMCVGELSGEGSLSVTVGVSDV